MHARTTAQEILEDFPQGIDVLITGVGTGGHITGCAQVLKAAWPKLKVFAVEPAASAVISGGQPSPHPIQGIGAGFIPKNLDTALLDGVIQVDAEPAREMARRCAREEGILVGISSGATLDRHRAETARAAGRRHGAGIQLRHRRALPVDRRLPARLTRRARPAHATRGRRLIMAASLLDHHKPRGSMIRLSEIKLTLAQAEQPQAPLRAAAAGILGLR